MQNKWSLNMIYIEHNTYFDFFIPNGIIGSGLNILFQTLE